MKIVAPDLAQLLLCVAVDKQRDEVVDRRVTMERLVMRQTDSMHSGGIDAVADVLSERVQDTGNLPLELFGCHRLSPSSEVLPRPRATRSSPALGSFMSCAPASSFGGLA